MEPESFKALICSLRTSCDKMVPFEGVEDRKLDCPWLTWAMKGLDDQIRPRGILIMQDWGLQGEFLSDAVRLIEEYSNSSQTGDPTLSNLLSSKAWTAAILNRTMLVTNAVWGLRRSNEDAPNKMCGYLGAVIHKRAFLQWGKLVALLSKGESQSDEFRLFVAGDWARFDGRENRSRTPIRDYLRCWKNWASRNLGAVSGFPKELNDEAIGECNGRVVFSSHPCTWNHRFESDPFASLDSVPAS